MPSRATPQNTDADIRSRTDLPVSGKSTPARVAPGLVWRGGDAHNSVEGYGRHLFR